MPTRIIDITLLLPPFLLVLFRIGGLALTAPVFASSGVPTRTKIGLAFIVTLMIAPVVWSKVPARMGLSDVVASVAGELMIGLIMGIAAGMVFTAAQLAGTFIGQQVGIGLGEVFDPMFDGESTAIGQVYFLVFMMIYLAIGGHRMLVAALIDTFNVIPPAGFTFNASFLTMTEKLITSAFELAVRLSAPALIALFMASLAMGFISRTIPQLNVLTIGFSVRIFIGLAVAAVALSMSYELIEDAIKEAMGMIRTTFGLDG